MNIGLKEELNARYSALAESSCCLSCGGAIDHAKPLIGEVCVDLGSGRGADVFRMADAVGPTGHVYGIDTAEGMLNRARTQAAALGVENATFVQSELESLKLPDRGVDLVLSNCTINHAWDKAKVWSEVFRILKPGGRFVVSDIYATEEVPERYRDDPKAVAECWAGAVERHTTFEMLEATGFHKIELLEESEPYDKGEIVVASFTVTGRRPGGCSCCCE